MMKKFFTFIAVAVMALAVQANVLSVCRGEYMSYISPVYGLSYNTPGVNQMIYPADSLAEMAGGYITEISFLTLGNLDGTPYGQDFSGYTLNFSGGELTLALKEVEQIGFTEKAFIADATVVATLVPEAGGYLLTFNLDEPFHYNGGNLMVEVKVQVPGNGETTYFWCTAMQEDTSILYFPTYMYNENESGEVDWNLLTEILPAADFTYEVAIEPTEQCAKPDGAYVNGTDFHGVTVTLTNNEQTEGTQLHYTVTLNDVVIITDAIYDGEFALTQDGQYYIDFWATAPGKKDSTHGGLIFTIDETTGLSEMASCKQVAAVRYFNMAGQEMQQAQGLTIVVTTYSDGTTQATKVIK